MTRRSALTAIQAAAKATEAAETLVMWLRAQPGRGERLMPDATPASERPEADTGVDALGLHPALLVGSAVPPELIDALGAATPAATPTVDLSRDEKFAPLRLAHTDWLHHRLLITGPAADVSAFQAAAAGAGTVPWQIDHDRVEEDLFHLLVAPTRSLSFSGARILAGQLRAAAARRHALAVVRVGHSRACPFDLHALVPVPDAILQRGPDDPEALAWLWAHWGTTQMLRHVAEDATAAAIQRGRAAPGEAVWVVAFWSADWTPWRALAQIAARWPSLRIDTRPTYDAL
jgi:hypothetical protein